MKDIWTIRVLKNWLEDFLIRKKLKNARYEAEIIISSTIGYKRLDLFLDLDRPIQTKELKIIKSVIKRRLNNEPLAYIVNRAYFWFFEIYVDSNVLIPRKETEHLVEAVIDITRDNQTGNPINILDWGTGSGVIALALATEISCNVIAIDNQKEAIKIAKKNHKILLKKFPNKKMNLEIKYSNGFSDLENQKFDIITANPPYVSEQEYITLSKECHYEPKEALVAKDEGLYYYKYLAKNSKKYLNKKGYIVIEHGATQRESIKNIFLDYQLIFSISDYSGNDRIMVFQ